MTVGGNYFVANELVQYQIPIRKADDLQLCWQDNKCLEIVIKIPAPEDHLWLPPFSGPHTRAR